MRNEADWSDGYEVIHGTYEYFSAADRFRIVLDKVEPITGQRISMVIAGDEPEWGNWMRVGSTCRIWPESKLA